MDKYFDLFRNILTVLGATAIIWIPLLTKYWPAGARSAMGILARISPEVIDEIQQAIRTKAVPGITLAAFILKLSAEKKWGLDSIQVAAIVELLKPIAKKAGWVVK